MVLVRRAQLQIDTESRDYRSEGNCIFVQGNLLCHLEQWTFGCKNRINYSKKSDFQMIDKFGFVS